MIDASKTIRPVRSGFTLIELLATIGIIALLTVLTVVSVRGITQDARLSSARNAVTAILENARARAMRENAPILVAFRTRQIDEENEVTEAVLAKFSGVTRPGGIMGVVDRFDPIVDAPARTLPVGVKIGAPFYRADEDMTWITTSAFVQEPGIVAGSVIGVMFAPDGTLLTSHIETDSDVLYVDFNGDGDQQQGMDSYTNFPFDPLIDPAYCDDAFGSFANGWFFCQAEAVDEPFVTLTPFLTVYDDAEARELEGQGGLAEWGDADIRIVDLTDYINDNADRIHFNRYTGVVMK